MSVAIKISENNYRELCMLSGKLQEERQKIISLNEALNFLLKKRSIRDLAGTWKGTDKEVDKTRRDLKKGWATWQIKSV